MAKVISKTKSKKVSSVVKNPVAKDASDVKKSAEELIKLDDDAKKRIKEINEEIKNNDKVIKSIEESRLTQKQQLENINNQLQAAYKIDINAGTKQLSEKQEKEYRSFQYKLKHAHDEVTDTQAQYGYTDKNKNPLYAKYEESKKELDIVKKSLKERGFAGSGIYKKVEKYPNKIIQIENEIGEYKQQINKIPPELRKLLGSGIDIYEKQVRGLSEKINNYQQQKDKLTKEQNILSNKQQKAESDNLNIIEELNNLNIEKSKAWDKKIPLAEERSRFLNRDDVENTEERFTNINIYDNARTVNERIVAFKTYGKGGFVRELNHLIYQDIINFLSKAVKGDIEPLFIAYARSHKLYYDNKTKKLEYYDKEGNGWGLFEDQSFRMDYEVAYSNGPILGSILTSHQIIQMAEVGRKGYIILAGKHTIHNKIAVPGAELRAKNGGTFGGGEFEGAIYTDEMYVKPMKHKGYFGIGLRTFVSKTIQKYQKAANEELEKIRKEIEKQDKIIKACNNKIKELNIENITKTNTNIIKNCKRKSARIDKELNTIEISMFELQKKLDDLKEANRIDTVMNQKINEKLREKRKYQQWLGNYQEQMDYINKLEEKTETLRIEAKEKYMESNRKKLIEERKKALETIPNNKKYQKYKKFHEENDEKNEEIKRRNIEEKEKKIQDLTTMRSVIDQSPQKTDRVKALKKRNLELREEKRLLKQGVQVKKEEVSKKAKNLEKKLPEVKIIKTEAKKEAVETAVEEVKEEVNTKIKEEVDELDERIRLISEDIAKITEKLNTIKIPALRKAFEKQLQIKQDAYNKVMEQIVNRDSKF